jgi:hypothetical protein
MSIYLCNSAENSRSQINFSTAKQTFSFSKSERFPQIKPYCTKHFYEAKEGISNNKGTYIGFGSRVTFESKRKGTHQKEHHHPTTTCRSQISQIKSKRMSTPSDCPGHLWLRWLFNKDVSPNPTSNRYLKAWTRRLLTSTNYWEHLAKVFHEA